jgi:hypothetical protein
MRTISGAAAILVVAFLTAGSAHAAVITGVTVQDSDGTVPNTNMTASDALDGNGLSSYSFSATHSTTWSDHWYSSIVAGAYITADLEANYSIDTIHVWNENEDNAGNARGLNRASIWVAPDENTANLVKLNTDGNGTTDDGLGDFLFPIGPKSSSYTGFSVDLSGVTNAALLDNVRLVKIETITNHGSSGGSGLAEVMFGGGAPVPEPSGFVLGLGLMGLLGCCRRRR